MKLGRDLAADLAVSTGLLGVAGRLESLRVPDIRVLAYHRVLPRIDEASFPYDVELVSAWEEEFDWQVGHVARHYDVITCRELASMLAAGRRVPRRALVITFDDGYRDNHDVVLPILQRHKVPAVIFVATDYMDRHSTFWFDEFVHDVLHTKADALTLDGATVTLAGGAPARREAARRVLLRLKTVSEEQRLEILAQLKQQLGVPAIAPGRQLGLNGPMSWSQVQALAKAGIEIGSHSVSHPILSKVGSEQLRRELVDSKEAIERHTGEPVVSMAYPVGGKSAYNDDVVAAVRAAGYRFAFTYGAGPNRPDHFDPYRMRRLAVERYVTRNRFSAMLAAPSLFAYAWSSGQNA